MKVDQKYSRVLIWALTSRASTIGLGCHILGALICFWPNLALYNLTLNIELN